MLYIIAIICCVIEALPIPTKIRWGWIGLAIFIFTLTILGHLHIN